jgi:uncharacterized protein (DUF488 family)
VPHVEGWLYIKTQVETCKVFIVKTKGKTVLQIFAIGHSTHPIEEFVARLKAFGIKTLADIRTIPGSRRNPQYQQIALKQALAKERIAYVHIKKLGGLRKGLGEASPNKAWENASFRGYADHMMTTEFEHGLQKLLTVAEKGLWR